MPPPSVESSENCRHLFARGRCQFHERARRSRRLEESVNFGGAADPRLARPAWVDAAPRRIAGPPPLSRVWSAQVMRLARALAGWLRAAAAPEEGFSSPWMASEAAAGGEHFWPVL